MSHPTTVRAPTVPRAYPRILCGELTLAFLVGGLGLAHARCFHLSASSIFCFLLHVLFRYRHVYELTRWCTRHGRNACRSTCYINRSYIPPIIIKPAIHVPLPTIIPSRFAYVPGTHTPTPSASTSNTILPSLTTSPRSARLSSPPPSRVQSFNSLSTLVPILSATETIFEEPEPIGESVVSGWHDVGEELNGYPSENGYDEDMWEDETVWMRPTRAGRWEASDSMDDEGPGGAEGEKPLGLGMEWYVFPGDMRPSGGTEQCWDQDVTWHVQKALSRAGIDLGGMIRRQPSRMMSLKPESPEGSSDETLRGDGGAGLEQTRPSHTRNKPGFLSHTSLSSNTSPSSFNSDLTLCDQPRAIRAKSTSISKRVSFADDVLPPPRQTSDTATNRRTSSIGRKESPRASGFMDKVRRRSSSLGLGGLFRSPPSTREVMPTPSPTPRAKTDDGNEELEKAEKVQKTEEIEIDVYRLPPTDPRRRYRHHDLPGYSARLFEKQHAFLEDYF